MPVPIFNVRVELVLELPFSTIGVPTFPELLVKPVRVALLPLRLSLPEAPAPKVSVLVVVNAPVVPTSKLPVLFRKILPVKVLA